MTLRKVKRNTSACSV